jgi:hypothetical protein
VFVSDGAKRYAGLEAHWRKCRHRWAARLWGIAGLFQSLLVSMALGNATIQASLESRQHFLGLVGTRKGLAQLQRLC